MIFSRPKTDVPTPSTSLITPPSTTVVMFASYDVPSSRELDQREQARSEEVNYWENLSWVVSGQRFWLNGIRFYFITGVHEVNIWSKYLPCFSPGLGLNQHLTYLFTPSETYQFYCMFESTTNNDEKVWTKHPQPQLDFSAASTRAVCFHTTFKRAVASIIHNSWVKDKIEDKVMYQEMAT